MFSSTYVKIFSPNGCLFDWKLTSACTQSWNYRIPNYAPPGLWKICIYNCLTATCTSFWVNPAPPPPSIPATTTHTNPPTSILTSAPPVVITTTTERTITTTIASTDETTTYITTTTATEPYYTVITVPGVETYVIYSSGSLGWVTIPYTFFYTSVYTQFSVETYTPETVAAGAPTPLQVAATTIVDSPMSSRFPSTTNSVNSTSVLAVDTLTYSTATSQVAASVSTASSVESGTSNAESPNQPVTSEYQVPSATSVSDSYRPTDSIDSIRDSMTYSLIDVGTTPLVTATLSEEPTTRASSDSLAVPNGAHSETATTEENSAIVSYSSLVEPITTQTPIFVAPWPNISSSAEPLAAA